MAAPAGAGASWCRLQAELGAGTASHLPAPSGLSQAQERDSSGLRVGGRERPVFCGRTGGASGLCAPGPLATLLVTSEQPLWEPCLGSADYLEFQLRKHSQARWLPWGAW